MPIVVLAVLAAFLFSLTQSLIGARGGSDHPVHAFLRDGIRSNDGRLFVTIPRLLNLAHCAALPLYLHWIMARLPIGAIGWSERLLNPLVNSAHVVLVAVIAGCAAQDRGYSGTSVAFVALLFALTPQFFHALSARNFGLSARGIGLVLLTAFLASSFQAGVSETPWAWWLITAILGWLIWGFSTFAQQALVILSALLLVLGGYWRPAVGAVLGLLLFIAMHREYSLSYLWHTQRFLRSYAGELAPIYIIQRRPSIWRDFVRDFWLKPRQAGLQKAVLYVYENSVLVVLLLNPLSVVAAANWIAMERGPGWMGYSITLATAGVLAAFLTSFRPTRFLGEPERYVEVVTPWSAICAVGVLQPIMGGKALAVTAGMFFVVNVVQLCASWMLMRRVQTTTDELDLVGGAIEKRGGARTRFCCNNEQLTKLLMGRNWQFAYFIAAGQNYAGMTATQAFSKFPFLNRAACEKVVRSYRVNSLLLDRHVFETVFDVPPADLQSMATIYESARFRLLALDWKS